ncbi:MAG TPA: cupin domain-containing protein [Thermoanaerobaculales bacterium]|nr:cupin domain-containing protein [Thermoanaerobaculales bacterium]HPA81973.1 cupin domain-containing protein [Thermoanaerobaculales bacterium]HQL31137.1 cupin domain-containing protein [Thermoanaerobaculales bacterium]HQN97044.1 cupin domain-containing protein [Thermoanaerobaculales bacterium]HQP44815.1 cupin domain-containing protein [Thermoanaerobaculales bacterium]
MATVTARFVDKPWGHEEIFARTERYVGKILSITAGESLSLQYHRLKEETLRVLDGEVELIAGDRADRLVSHRLAAGAVFHVPPGTLHRLTAVTSCRLVEVSTPELDDVVRLDDRYGRAGTSDP